MNDKINLFTLLTLLICTNVSAMKRAGSDLEKGSEEKKQKTKQSQAIEKEIYPIRDLPKDMQQNIILQAIINEPTPEEVIKKIQKLKVTSKEFQQNLESPHFCLQLIKSLANKFKEMDEAIASALPITKIQELVNLHNEFKHLIENNTNRNAVFNSAEHFDEIEEFIETNKNIDPNWIYEENSNPLDLLLFKQVNNPKKPAYINTIYISDILNTLINLGANVHLPMPRFDIESITPIQRATNILQQWSEEKKKVTTPADLPEAINQEKLWQEIVNILKNTSVKK